MDDEAFRRALAARPDLLARLHSGDVAALADMIMLVPGARAAVVRVATAQ